MTKTVKTYIITSNDDNELQKTIVQYKRPWNRASNMFCMSNTAKELDMRRKAEILKYKRTSTNSLTKAQSYAQLARGINPYKKKSWASQSYGPPDSSGFQTKPNTGNLAETYQNTSETNNIVKLTCTQSSTVTPMSTSKSDVPKSSTTPNGLILDYSIPLTRYGFMNRTYKGGIGKWPLYAWDKNSNGFPIGKKGGATDSTKDYFDVFDTRYYIMTDDNIADALLAWDTDDNVLDTYRPISVWDVSSVTNMSGNAEDGIGFFPSSFNNNISDWDTSNVTNMSQMFKLVTSFNQDISNWDTSQVTDMSQMFYEATSFNNGESGSILDWDTSNVKDMSYMFNQASAFNQSIGDWDTSKVTNMTYMFNRAIAFNMNINSSDDGNSWNTSAVNNMSNMFTKTNSFNQDIGDWDTSTVNNMSGMFENNTAFNNGESDNILSWDTSTVNYMEYMFSSATSFNQDLSEWNVSSVDEYSMFDDNTTSWTIGWQPTFNDP